ncbi:MAG: 2-dehydro-3-deoxyphosphogluconate aldolase / (4S)-4-hydroxy-2-oxoglutarate aldolase [Mycobacterium sp.]|nr:2-dehydro-3-deoxyphosphogluconate aldolase / (4S)-4-hydroxy-2-oxoglutarate aldolase [Mycobacterium sp.]
MTADDEPLSVITSDRAVTVVRAPRPFDVTALASALARGGLRAVELTLTTPGILDRLATTDVETVAPQAVIGVGTVLNAADANAAIDAGARFLVTPAVSVAVARVAADSGVPLIMGALTPTEVMAAVDLGASAVKIFPARAHGPAYLRDLLGPFPALSLIPSGGVNAGNAADYLAAGAVAVTAGTDVVTPALVDAARWDTITDRAAAFAAAVNTASGAST